VQGQLSEFRLAEILQLVAVQQKTGLLRLNRGKEAVTFYFDHGVLVSCRDRRHVVYDPLLDYLQRTGWLPPEMVASLRDRMENSREDVAELLLGDRFMTEEELGAILEDLAQELVHKTFTWRDGTYQFVSGDEALTGLRYTLQLKIDSVLMEGARRADEWPRLQEKLPGPDVVLDLIRDPGTTLGTRALGVLSQLHGVMRLGDLIKVARVPEYEVYETVANAVDAGIARIVEKPAAPPAPETSEPAPRPARSARVLWSLPRPLGWSLALGVSVLSAIAAWQVAPRLVDGRIHEAALSQTVEAARESLRTQVEVYRALHGRYPASLADLVAADLASSALLQHAAPVRYVLANDGQSFLLATDTEHLAAQ
jgi:hypothetical protein